MIQPDFKTFCKLARQGNLVPVYEIIRGDLLTPVSAYLRLARDARYACLLESVEGGEKIARYTFVGANPAEVFRYRDGACVLESKAQMDWQRAQPMEYLRNLVQRYRAVRVPGLPPLVSGAIGYFAYDMVRQFEKLPDSGHDDVALDDAVMMFYLGLVAFDHVQHRIWIVRSVFTEGTGSARSRPHGNCSSNRCRRKSRAANLRGERAPRPASLRIFRRLAFSRPSASASNTSGREMRSRSSSASASKRPCAPIHSKFIGLSVW